MQKIVQVSELRKSYGANVAVDGVSFDVYRGEMFALLGPNGAGKSTIVSILSTSMTQDSGDVIIDGLALGRNNRKIRKKIGVVFQKGVLDEMLTVEQNLSMRAGLYGLKGRALRQQVMETGKLTGISGLMDQLYGQLSGGQQRRCDVARALVHHPDLLFLDEPTTGLDPKIRTSIWQTIHEIRKKNGLTVFLTTHDMNEAEAADRIMIMRKGKMAAEGTPEELRRRFVNDRLVLFSDNRDPLVSMLERAGIRCSIKGNHIEISLHDTLGAIPILEFCRGRYTSFEVIKGSMENAYISIVERG